MTEMLKMKSFEGAEGDLEREKRAFKDLKKRQKLTRSVQNYHV